MMIRRAALCSIVLGTAASSAVGSGQDPAVIRSRTDAVQVEASVTRANRPVRDLSIANFALTDRGLPQTITSVSAERVPIDMTVSVDVSSIAQDHRRIDDFKREIERFGASLMNPTG